MTAKTTEELRERMVAQRFRKKPVVIEAWPFDGSWASAEPIVALASHLRWSSRGNGGVLHIDTLEGTMEALADDWIIKGTKGEFYPCKPAVFADVYEPEDAADSAGWQLMKPTPYDPDLGKITAQDREYALDLLDDRSMNDPQADQETIAQWLRKVRYEAVIADRKARGDLIDNARAQAIEECADNCEREAAACISDIVPGDEQGAKLAHARAGALLTAAADLRALSAPPKATP